MRDMTKNFQNGTPLCTNPSGKYLCDDFGSNLQRQEYRMPCCGDAQIQQTFEAHSAVGWMTSGYVYDKCFDRYDVWNNEYANVLATMHVFKAQRN